MDINTILLIIGLGAIGFLVRQQKAPSTDGSELKDKEISELQHTLKASQDENIRLKEKGKAAFAEQTKLDAALKSSNKERDQYLTKLTKLESEEGQRVKEQEKKISELENARQRFEDEQNRVRNEDEERIRLAEEARDRMWGEHESMCIATMKEICQRPEMGFSFYDNTNLPSSFDGSFKPDFLVEFLGQYIIFDPKTSKSQKASNLQTYLSDQARSTAKKIAASKNKGEIYSVLYFLVPGSEVSALKKRSFFEKGFSIYVIPVEAFAPIMASYKKILQYEIADENFDPQDREAIINLIAKYDWHISKQNAVNLIMAQEGIDAMETKTILDPEMKEEVEIKKSKMRLGTLRPTDMKRLMTSNDEQKTTIDQLKNPSRVKIEKADLEDASKTIREAE